MYPHSVLYLLTRRSHFVFFFFFNDTATTEIYTLSLHDALPILVREAQREPAPDVGLAAQRARTYPGVLRSEEHTSELQSPCNLVCRLLLEKKKKTMPLSSPSPRRTLPRPGRRYRLMRSPPCDS